MKFLYVIALSILIFTAPAFGGAELVGTTSINFIKIHPLARAASMGEAFTAVSDGTSGIYYNPAGMSLAPGFEAQASHISWFQDLHYEYFSFLSPAPFLNDGKIGLAVSWFQVDKMAKTKNLDSYDSGYLNSGIDFNSFIEDYFSPFDYEITLAYSANIQKNFLSGISLKFASQNIKDFSGYNISADIGLLYKIVFNENYMRLGISLSNLGTQLKMDELSFESPKIFNAGLSDELEIFGNKFLISAQTIIPTDYKSLYSLGVEYRLFNNILSLRAGYKLGAFEQPTFGAGIRYKGIELDYAFINYTELGDTHRISILYSWGTPPVNLKIHPYLFSPNKDNKFDVIYFTPIYKSKQNLKSAKINIFDEAGILKLSSVPIKSPYNSQIPWNGMSNKLILSDGTYSASLIAEYETGTSESPKIKFEIDNTPPNINISAKPTILKPDANNILLIPATFHFDVFDKNNVSSWQFVIWDKNKNVFFTDSGKGAPPLSYKWEGKGNNNTYVETGEIYYYGLFANDTVSNKGKSKPKAIVILLKEIKLTFSSDALFDIGEADVKISAYHILKDMKHVIAKYPESEIVVTGFTDNLQPHGIKYKTNKILSKARADAVKFFMVNLLGIKESRIKTEGVGDLFPLASNGTLEGRQKNRRVEIKIKSTIYK